MIRGELRLAGAQGWSTELIEENVVLKRSAVCLEASSGIAKRRKRKPGC
jgi:hypothetical protein